MRAKRRRVALPCAAAAALLAWLCVACLPAPSLATSSSRSHEAAASGTLAAVQNEPAIRNEKKHNSVVVTNNNHMKQAISFHMRDPERDKVEAKYRKRADEHEEKREEKERARKNDRDVDEQKTKQQRYVTEAKAKVAARKAKELAQKRRERREKALAAAQRARQPPPPPPQEEVEVLHQPPEQPESIAFPSPLQLGPADWEVPGMDDAFGDGQAGGPAKDMTPGNQPDANEGHAAGEEDHGSGSGRNGTRHGRHRGNNNEESEEAGNGSEGGPPEFRVGGGSWSVLPFRGNRTLWQLFGDTCFSRTVGKHYYVNTGGMHEGLDIGMPCGTPVYSVCDGKVFSAGNLNPFGSGPNSVILSCDNKYIKYGHLMSVAVKQGFEVKAGDVVGMSGTPDASSNCHLHFEVRVGAGAHPTVVINPVTCFTKKFNHYFLLQIAKLRDSYCSDAAGHTFDIANAPKRPAECENPCPPPSQPDS